MKVLSLKLREAIFEEVERVVKAVHISRNAYINEALSFYNKIHQRKLLRSKLHREAKVAKAASLQMLAEFDAIEDRLPE